MSAPPRLIRIRYATAVVLCVVYPLLSYVVPGVGPAWAMYTGTRLYRLHIVVYDHAGTRYAIPATAVTRRTTPTATMALLGAEDWHHGFPATFPTQLDRFARLLCEDARVARAEVELDVRDAATEGQTTTRASTRCPRLER